MLYASFRFHSSTAIITQNGIIRFVFVMRTDCVLWEVEAHAADTQRFSLMYVSSQQIHGDLRGSTFRRPHQSTEEGVDCQWVILVRLHVRR